MIRVTCAACDQSFSAKDELAGRKGKCPGCGAPIVVGPAPANAPAAPSAAASKRPSAAFAAPVSAPVVAPSGAPRGGGRRSSAGSRGRSSRSRSKGGLGGVIVVVALAAGVAGAAWFLRGGGEIGKDAFGQGQEALLDGRFDDAIALLAQVAPESPLYKTAQEKLTEARDQKQAITAMETSKSSNALYEAIKATEKHYVMAEAPSGANYSPYARYLLKRCLEFCQRFPTDSRSAELAQYDFKYAQVASLDKPPTEADVDGELTFRCLLPSPDYRAAYLAIDEFSKQSADNADAVRRLRDRVQSSSLEYWKQIHSKLQREGDLKPGAENWQRVANQCLRYLSSIEGLPGLVPAMDAQALYARATEG